MKWQCQSVREMLQTCVQRGKTISAGKGMGSMQILSLLIKDVYLAFGTVVYCMLGKLQMSCKAFLCT